MKRNIILISLLFLFNFLWLYGISYVNSFIVSNDLMIIFGEDKEEIPSEEIPSEEIVEYDGEGYEAIGKKIEKYLEKTSLEGLGEYIAKHSVNKGVNPYLVGAIIIVNSNCNIQCTAIVDSCYNVGDLKGSLGGCFGGTYKKYYSFEDSIDDLINYILTDFYSKDLKTPSAIYKKYDKNSAWSYKVSRYMEKIKKTK